MNNILNKLKPRNILPGKDTCSVAHWAGKITGLRAIRLNLVVFILLPGLLPAQSISGRVVALLPPVTIDNINNFTYNISIDTCLKHKKAFWYANSKITVLLTAYPDSIFTQSITDSLGYFSVKIPGNVECYLKIEEAYYHWGKMHLPLFIRNIKLGHSITLAFIPYLKNLIGLSEYVAVPVKRKFPFLKKRYQIIHEPPPVTDVYLPGKYTFSYGDFKCVLDKSNDGSEIDFSVLIHNNSR